MGGLFKIVLLCGRGLFHEVPGGPAGFVWFHLRMSKGVPTFFAGVASALVPGVNMLLVGVERFLTFGTGVDVEVKLIPDREEICRLVMVFPAVTVEMSFMSELSLALVTGIKLVVFDMLFTEAPPGNLSVIFLACVFRILACVAAIMDGFVEILSGARAIFPGGLPLPLEDGAATFSDAVKLLAFDTLIPG